MYFCKIENFAYGEIIERSFSNTHPRTLTLRDVGPTSILGLYEACRRTSCCKISRSLKAARLDVMMFVSGLWRIHKTRVQVRV